MPDQQSLEVRTSARLHFGLWAWGDLHERQFGGLGMMIAKPLLILRFARAEQFAVDGPLAHRAKAVALRCVTHWALDSLPAVDIEIATAPPPHAGYGVGTQLALAIARGLAEWTGNSLSTAEELAAATGRGLRSAVGTHGFLHGGLIVDGGKRDDDIVGRLENRLTVPEAWRLVLVTPRDEVGKAGDDELSAFAELPAVPMRTTERLQQLARERMVPAGEAEDFAEFSSAVYEYGRLAGECFASVQGGAYASSAVASLVARLRELGAIGVGQSSWGPTVFALQPDQRSAEELVSEFTERIDLNEYEITITAPRNHGVEVVR